MNTGYTLSCRQFQAHGHFHRISLFGSHTNSYIPSAIDKELTPKTEEDSTGITMIAPKAFVRSLLLALVVQLTWCTTTSTCHIFPTCPDGTECRTLSDATNEHEKYFSTNTTLILHPGDHKLHQRVLALANITGLTIMSCGNCTGSNCSNTRILCMGTDPSFSFFGVSDVRIMAISFVSCKLEFISEGSMPLKSLSPEICMLLPLYTAIAPPESDTPFLKVMKWSSACIELIQQIMVVQY